METLNCMRCKYRHEDNGNCTAVGGFCTAVTAAHCPLLREYLDTGLTPGQAVNAKNIIELAFADDTSKAERIRKLVAADDEGRVVALPCKVGDVIYKLFREYTECTSYQTRKDNYCCEGCMVPCDSREVTVIRAIQPNSLPEVVRYIEDIGKTVFLTREEAEKALEARKDG